MRRLPLTFMCSAATAFAFAPRATFADTAFSRFAQLARSARYEVRLETYEELGDRSADATYRYRRSPEAAELDVLEGRGASVRMIYRDRRLTVFAGPDWPGIGHRIAPDDPRVTSLRGNGILSADLGVLAACFAAHAESLREIPGPRLDGRATTEIVFVRNGAWCANDSNRDRAITTDIVYVAADSAIPLLRKRFIGRALVEQWRMRDFAIDSGPSD